MLGNNIGNCEMMFTYLMFSDELRSGTEPASCTEPDGDRTDEHIYFRSLSWVVRMAYCVLTTRHTGTLYSSVRPRPVRPTTPNEYDSSRIRRYLYFSFSSI